jgi:purine-binding chemotaxis protein CheW
MTVVQSSDADGMIAVGTDTGQYLTFMLAGEEYGVDILRVQEIKEWDMVTALPNTPSYVKGVINLRGTIVPIIDLRQRFGLESIPYGPTTVVVVLKVVHDSGSRIMGLVVDAVSDVYNVSNEELKPPPQFGSMMHTNYIKGLATVNERMLIVLDIDRLLNTGELAATDGTVY